MTYTYRLSRRLAVLRRSALVVLVAATTFCGGQDQELTDQLGPSLSASGRWKDLGRLRISPDSITLAVGQTGKFVAYATSWSGDSSQVKVVWSASGGTVDSTGQFSSASAGAFRIVAQRSWKGRQISDTARVDVIAVSQPAVPIVRLVIAPDTVTVPVGQTRKFAAIARLRDSSTAPAIVSWSATGGTIDSVGSFKAGTVPGKFRVTASSAAALLSDTAAVVVSAPSPMPPTLTQLVLTPATTALAPSATQQFTVAATWSDGSTAVPPVTYSVTGGTITSGGLYSAAATPGTYRVIATQSGGVQADTSAVTVTAPTPPPPDGNAVPATFFGMHLIDKTKWPTAPIGALGKGTVMTWPYIEPTSGVRNWSNLDAWVNQAQAHGVPFIMSMELAPPWAVSDQSTCASAWGYVRCTGMPNLTAYDAFVTALVTRYKGRIALYELYNEPDVVQIGGNGFSGTVAQLVTLTQHAYNIIRANDPAALIGSPSGGGPYMDQYWAAGGVKTVDVLAMHAYPDPGRYTTPTYPAPEKVCCGNYLIGPLKTVFAKYGLTQPIWDTEGSWNTADGTMADPDQQAAFVARWHLLHWSEGIRRMYWYAWDNGNWGTLWDATTGEHKAAKAYREVYSWMVGATMPSACTWSGPTTAHMPKGTIGSCLLTRPGGYQALAVWNTNGPSSYTAAATYTRYRDLDGNTVPITGPITIGYKPILLESLQ